MDSIITHIGEQRDFGKYRKVLETGMVISSDFDLNKIDKILRGVIDKSIRRQRFIRRPKEYEYFTRFYRTHKITGRLLFCFIS